MSPKSGKKKRKVLKGILRLARRATDWSLSELDKIGALVALGYLYEECKTKGYVEYADIQKAIAIYGLTKLVRESYTLGKDFEKEMKKYFRTDETLRKACECTTV